MKKSDSIALITLGVGVAVSMGTVLLTPAWAINKCTGADGKVAFQDAPCQVGKSEQISVRPASGDGPTTHTPMPASNATDRQKTEAQRLEALISDSQRDRRKRDLQERLFPDAQAEIANHKAASRYHQPLYRRFHGLQPFNRQTCCDTEYAGVGRAQHRHQTQTHASSFVNNDSHGFSTENGALTAHRYVTSPT